MFTKSSSALMHDATYYAWMVKYVRPGVDLVEVGSRGMLADEVLCVTQLMLSHFAA